MIIKSFAVLKTSGVFRRLLRDGKYYHSVIIFDLTCRGKSGDLNYVLKFDDDLKLSTNCSRVPSPAKITTVAGVKITLFKSFGV